MVANIFTIFISSGNELKDQYLVGISDRDLPSQETPQKVAVIGLQGRPLASNLQQALRQYIKEQCGAQEVEITDGNSVNTRFIPRAGLWKEDSIMPRPAKLTEDQAIEMIRKLLHIKPDDQVNILPAIRVAVDSDRMVEGVDAVKKTLERSVDFGAFFLSVRSSVQQPKSLLMKKARGWFTKNQRNGAPDQQDREPQSVSTTEVARRFLMKGSSQTQG